METPILPIFAKYNYVLDIRIRWWHVTTDIFEFVSQLWTSKARIPQHSWRSIRSKCRHSLWCNGDYQNGENKTKRKRKMEILWRIQSQSRLRSGGVMLQKGSEKIQVLLCVWNSQPQNQKLLQHSQTIKQIQSLLPTNSQWSGKCMELHSCTRAK